MERECPGCGHWIEFDDHMIAVTCAECQQEYLIDVDAEFRDGSWRDLTKLIPQKAKQKQSQLLSSDQAITIKRQHISPCADCPFRRSSLPGWLGGGLPENFAAAAHSDGPMHCHTRRLCDGPAHCAGAAIYRANVCKMADFTLPQDKAKCFANPLEFMEHHEPARALSSELPDGYLAERMLKMFGPK